MNHGYWTVILGRRLKKDIKHSKREDLKVFYDHGEAGESCKIVPYFEQYGTNTTLSNVDLAIVNKNEQRILALCEFEEEGARPKLVIGDIYNIFIADKVRIKKRIYKLDNCKFLLGVRIEEKENDGQRYAEEKVKSLGEMADSVVQENKLKGIEVITITGPDYKQMTIQMERTICDIVGLSMAAFVREDVVFKYRDQIDEL